MEVETWPPKVLSRTVGFTVWKERERVKEMKDGELLEEKKHEVD